MKEFWIRGWFQFGEMTEEIESKVEVWNGTAWVGPGSTIPDSLIDTLVKFRLSVKNISSLREVVTIEKERVNVEYKDGVVPPDSFSPFGPVEIGPNASINWNGTFMCQAGKGEIVAIAKVDFA